MVFQKRFHTLSSNEETTLKIQETGPRTWKTLGHMRLQKNTLNHRAALIFRVHFIELFSMNHELQ